MSLPELILDIGFTGAAGAGDFFTVGDPVRGQVGVTPVGDGTAWTRIDPGLIRSWSARSGATKGDDPTLRYDAATGSVILHDPDRRFDMENLLGPYVVGGRSQVEPMVRVRLRAVWAGITYAMIVGYADDFDVQYEGNFWTYVTVPFTDASVIFAANDRDLSAPVGGGETSGARLNRILDVGGWPASDRNIATGDTVLQATELSGNQMTEMQLVQDTEMGDLFIDGQGWVTFRNRLAMLTDPRSTTSQAVFGDDPAGYAISGELPYADAKPSSPGDSIVNDVTVSRAGGTEQRAEDVVSKARYLKKTHTRNDLLMTTDAAALQAAQAILYQFATPRPRFGRLEFRTPAPQVESVVWPAVLARRFGDRITIRRRPKGGGDVIERDCFVRGWEHASDGAEWTSAFVLQSADRFSFFVVGDPLLGRVGLNAVAL